MKVRVHPAISLRLVVKAMHDLESHITLGHRRKKFIVPLVHQGLGRDLPPIEVGFEG